MEFRGAHYQEDWLIATLALDVKQEGLDWYHVNTALRYWQRRAIDGTADSVFGLLDKMLRSYDASYLSGAQRPEGGLPRIGKL